MKNLKTELCWTEKFPSFFQPCHVKGLLLAVLIVVSSSLLKMKIEKCK